MNDNPKKEIGFLYAWHGLVIVFKNERNFRIHIVATVIVVVMGLFLNLNITEWLLICLTISMVLVTEVINSTIEKTVDYISTDKHPKAKVIKDMAAAAVLITALTSVVIGVIIFLPKIIKLMS